MKVYQVLANLVQAMHNCQKSGNAEWLQTHTDRAKFIVKEYMPSGSGIDTGTHWDPETSSAARLVFRFSYHHMNDDGMYDGWTDHTLVVIPSLTSDISLRITGDDRNNVKEYLYEVYRHALTQEVAP